MTEKRFILDDAGELIDLNNHKFVDYGEECCNLLNELAEENKDLEEARSYYQENFLTMKTERNQLKKENKELKTFKDKVFALIDARIEIYKRKPFMAPVSAPFSVNFDEDTDRLARLAELEQLKKELSE